MVPHFLSLAFFSLSAMSVGSFLTRRTSSTFPNRQIKRNSRGCLVEVLPLTLPQLDNGTEGRHVGLGTISLPLPHVVGSQK